MALYEPLGDNSTNGQIFKINFKSFALGTVLLPLTAFLACIFISIVFHFEQSTATHCHVDNYLPSISAAIGSYQPQRYIWRISIALHAAPRFMIGLMYYNYYKLFIVRNPYSQIIIRLAVFFYTMENAALILLSYVSSLENKAFHEYAFTAFVIWYTLYMFLTVVIFWRYLNSGEEKERYSFRIKRRLMIINVSSLICAVYCYNRHISHCEPYVYTAFALFEYVFVLTNMGFHMTAHLDFRNYVFTCFPFHLQKIR